MSDEHDELIAWRNRFPEYSYNRASGLIESRSEPLAALSGTKRPLAAVALQKQTPAQPVDPVSETDWGQGIGGREKPIDPQAFRDELSDLRDRTTEKRNRRGMP